MHTHCLAQRWPQTTLAELINGSILQTLSLKYAFWRNLRREEEIPSEWTHLKSTRLSCGLHLLPLTAQLWSEIPLQGLLLEMVPISSLFTFHLPSFNPVKFWFISGIRDILLKIGRWPQTKENHLSWVTLFLLIVLKSLSRSQMELLLLSGTRSADWI